MKGYIAVVARNDDDAYRAEVVDVPGCDHEAATVEEALYGAEQTLRRMAESGEDLPQPRPSLHMIQEVERRSAVAGACLRNYRAVA